MLNVNNKEAKMVTKTQWSQMERVRKATNRRWAYNLFGKGLAEETLAREALLNWVYEKGGIATVERNGWEPTIHIMVGPVDNDLFEERWVSKPTQITEALVEAFLQVFAPNSEEA